MSVEVGQDRRLLLFECPAEAGDFLPGECDFVAMVPDHEFRSEPCSPLILGRYQFKGALPPFPPRHAASKWPTPRRQSPTAITMLISPHIWHTYPSRSRTNCLCLLWRRRDGQHFSYTFAPLAFTAPASIVPAVLVQYGLSARLVFLHKFRAGLPCRVGAFEIFALANKARREGPRRRPPQKLANVGAVVSVRRMGLK